MARDGQDIAVAQDEAGKTPCDCCGKTTLRITGDPCHADDRIAFHRIRLTEAHPDMMPRFSIGTGDRSKGAARTEPTGFSLLGLAAEGVKAVTLNHADSPAPHLALLDTILPKDDKDFPT